MLQDLSTAAALMLEDKALAYPTETYYGLGCAALSVVALDQLATWKPRDPQAKPYPLIIGDATQLAMLSPSSARTPLLEALIARFWPGPLTLILPGLPTLDPRICSPAGGVAMRVSSHPSARALALALGQPIVSTSANPAGQPPPQTPDDVSAGFAPRELPVFDGGRCAGGAPSTILSLLEGKPQLLRHGAISAAQLAAAPELAPWLSQLGEESTP